MPNLFLFSTRKEEMTKKKYVVRLFINRTELYHVLAKDEQEAEELAMDGTQQLISENEEFDFAEVYEHKSDSYELSWQGEE